MGNRYDQRRMFTNDRFRYRTIFERRAVKRIQQFGTGAFSYPRPEQMKGLKTYKHVWTTGDHYYKLAQEFYSDSSYWWVIALFNLKPTEAELEYGDVIYIPEPLEGSCIL